jgi:hypothetical protein
MSPVLEKSRPELFSHGEEQISSFTPERSHGFTECNTPPH